MQAISTAIRIEGAGGSYERPGGFKSTVSGSDSGMWRDTCSSVASGKWLRATVESVGLCRFPTALVVSAHVWNAEKTNHAVHSTRLKLALVDRYNRWHSLVTEHVANVAWVRHRVQALHNSCIAISVCSGLADAHEGSRRILWRRRPRPQLSDLLDGR